MNRSSSPSERATRSSAARATKRGFVVVVAVSVLAVANPVDAHVLSKPNTVKPGAETSVGFVIPHGCGKYPSTTIAIKFPAGVTKVTAVAPTGWAGSVKGSVATFSGGTLDAKMKGEFTLKFTAPTKEGPLYFPTIQTCTLGKTAWTQIPGADGVEGQRPAPRVNVSTKTPKVTETTVPAVH